MTKQNNTKNNKKNKVTKNINKDYLSNLNSNKDIGKQKINNKLKNINFLMKPNVFTNLLVHVHATTDNSMAYIPTMSRDVEINKNNFTYFEPNESNNYADLIIKNHLNYGFKAVRVKSLHAIDMNGSHITWDLCCINNFNFLVFYSINPNEVGKIIIIDTKTYADFIIKFNNMCPILDIDILAKIKQKFSISDECMKIIDYSKEVELNDVEETNILLKYSSCCNTLNHLNKNALVYTNKKTHIGHQYIAYNFKDGRKIIFRDAHARNNFFNWNTNVKLADNHVITRNCKNQTKIVKGCEDELEKLQMNIYENEGWIITSYIGDDEKFKEYILTLVHKLCILSDVWKRRLFNLLETIDKVMEKISTLILKIKERIKYYIYYFRPLNLLDYVTHTFEVNMKNYFSKHVYMQKFYLKC